jgi:hypothetical protein
MGVHSLVICRLPVRKATRHSAIVVVPFSRLDRASKSTMSCRPETLINYTNLPITFYYGPIYKDRVSLAIGVTRLSQTHETDVGEAKSGRAGK